MYTSENLCICLRKIPNNFNSLSCHHGLKRDLVQKIRMDLPVVTITPDHQSIIVGNPVTLGCSVQSNPMHTTVVWRKMVNGVATDLPANSRYSGSTVSNTSPSITNAHSSDPPTLVYATPNSIVVEEGNTITTTCTATGNPQPTFQWFKISDLSNPISNDAVLTIRNAQESDKGSYVCRSINIFGTYNAFVTADVQFRPKVVIPELEASGKTGLAAEIRCTQKSNPLATSLTWTKIVSNIVLSTIKIDNVKYFGGTVLSPTLIITNLDASDEASYRCSAINTVGTGNSANTVLTVQLPPPPVGIDIYPAKITVLEGHAFSMYCNVTEYPVLRYQWFHDDIMMREEQTYSVAVSKYNAHDGLYTCKAYNSVGYLQKSIDVDVKYPPISNLQDNMFNAILNSPVTFRCDTLANPSAVQWEWYNGDFRLTDVPNNQKDYVLDMNDANDAGEYSCIAFNEVGHSSKLKFTVTLDTSGTTPQGLDLSGGEVAAICLGILFFISLLIFLIVCCIQQDCCICCSAAEGKNKGMLIKSNRGKVYHPRFNGAIRWHDDYDIPQHRLRRHDNYVDDRNEATRNVSTPSCLYYLSPADYI